MWAAGTAPLRLRIGIRSNAMCIDLADLKLHSAGKGDEVGKQQ